MLASRRTERSAHLVWVACLSALLAAGCGSSSSSNITAPSSGGRCGLSVSAEPSSLTAAGGTGIVAIGVNRECSWTARAESDWIALLTDAKGQGEARLTFRVNANVVPSARRGTIVVNDQRIEISQSGAPCTFAIGSDSRAVNASGESYPVSVASLAGCTWTAAASMPWLAVTPASGDGNGSVTITVAPNAGERRAGTVIIAGQSHVVTQAPAVNEPSPPVPPTPPPGVSCDYALTAAIQPVGAEGGPGVVGVIATAGCPWIATSQVSWVSIVGGNAGSGSANVQFNVAPNASANPRSGTLTAAGQTLVVNQSGAGSPPPPQPPPPEPPPPQPPPTPPPASCSYTVAPTSISSAADGLTTALTVTTSETGCAWTAASGESWAVLGSSGGTGSGQVQVTIAANPGEAARSTTLTVAGRAVSVAQAGATAPPPPPPACTFTVDPLSLSVGAGASDQMVRVTASAPTCAWTAAASVNWIAFTSPAAGQGTGLVRFNVAANADTNPRAATLTIGGQSVSVMQAGASPPPPPCTFAVSPPTQQVPPEGGTGQMTVGASAATCAWTVSSEASWITITSGPGGTGPGQVTFTATANPGPSARTGTLTAAGQAIQVTQPPPPPPCTYTLSRTSISTSSLDTPETINVTTGAGCAWTAESRAPWITLTRGATGTGSGVVEIQVAVNLALTARVGTVLIAGQTVTVTQAGLLGITP